MPDAGAPQSNGLHLIASLIACLMQVLLNPIDFI
jgi:hypothetical protein